MCLREVRVPHSHLDRLVAEQLFYGGEIGAVHHEMTREAVPQVVETEVSDSRLTTKTGEFHCMETVSTPCLKPALKMA